MYKKKLYTNVTTKIILASYKVASWMKHSIFFFSKVKVLK
jgi:hypothetical protein